VELARNSQRPVSLAPAPSNFRIIRSDPSGINGAQPFENHSSETSATRRIFRSPIFSLPEPGMLAPGFLAADGDSPAFSNADELLVATRGGCCRAAGVDTSN
jgi:hypothetical protein